MASTATSLSSSGPSVSGKPWPRLTEPVVVASSDMVEKMVVVKGRSRLARYASAAPTRPRVPGRGYGHRLNGVPAPSGGGPAPTGGGRVLTSADRVHHRQLQHALRDRRVGSSLRRG